MNYLASPPLVIAYALAGTMDFDFETQPLGKDQDGNDVYLKDIWPTNEEVAAVWMAPSAARCSSRITPPCSKATAVGRALTCRKANCSHG